MTKSRLIDLLKLADCHWPAGLAFLKLPDPAALWQQILHANKVLLLLGATLLHAGRGGQRRSSGACSCARPASSVPTGRLLSYQWMAEFFNNFLPAQVGGDVMRGYAVAVDTQRTADATASVLIDRFIGLIVFMLFAALASIAMLIWGKPDGTALLAGGSALHAFRRRRQHRLAALALLRRRRRRCSAGASSGSSSGCCACCLSVDAHAADLEQAGGRLRRLSRPAWRAGRSRPWAARLIVILTSVNIWLISWAVQPDSISLLEVLAINPIIVFALLVVPLSPGGLGVRQVSFAGLFLFMGAGYALGTAVGLLQQFIGYIVSLPGGILWVRGNYRRGATPPAPSVPVESR